MTVQAKNVVISTLEIIDINGVQKFLRSEVHVAAAESSSPHVHPRSFDVHPKRAAHPPDPQAQGNLYCVI
jgi:hypothetical protein